MLPASAPDDDENDSGQDSQQDQIGKGGEEEQDEILHEFDKPGKSR